MSFPQSFSTTADCPFMDNSPSSVTVRLSTSSNPLSPLISRRVSFSAEVDGQARTRPNNESSGVIVRATPPIPNRSRFSPSRMSQSGSIASLLLSVRSRSRSKTTASDHDQPAKEDTPLIDSCTSWFGKACDFIRPWEDNDEEEIPEEQKQAFNKTREVSALLNMLMS